MVHTDFPTYFLAVLLVAAALLVGRPLPDLASVRGAGLTLGSLRASRLRAGLIHKNLLQPQALSAVLQHKLAEVARWREDLGARLQVRLTLDRLGLLCVAAALLCGIPAGTVLFIGAAILLLHAPGEAFCRPAIAVPLLLVYALYPGIWGVLALLPVLFWPGGHRACGQVAGSFLAVGLAAHVHPAMPALWLCGSVVIMGALGLAALAVHPTPRAVAAFLPMRPMILLGLMQAATSAGLEASAQAALAALMLDLALQALGVLRPGWEGLLLPVPPLPGFLVLWLGLHAALGLATGTPDWTPGGLFLACLLGGLSLAEGLAVLSWLGGRPITLAFLIGAFLVPLGLVLLSVPAGHVLITPAETGSAGWQQAFWQIRGGDGALLAWPLGWGMLLAFWCFFVRPWRHHGAALGLRWPDLFSSGTVLSDGEAGDLVRLRLMQKRLARRAFRLALRLKKFLGLLQLQYALSEWRWPSISVGFWMAFLGFMLALVEWGV
ncbi:hypothetical protein [Oecophyllibacter saccharovorans]|uniref:hypothetical protein n=1 Tax=Oecophyllibacter saccharovorans TaxID=2558360 RepID=UPI001166F9B5|nr:hypothetical protein [Oecophyllibacter saccharovorans]TPW34947.1 hypothetical protein E3203_05465 [Oecophyllibacter saccharovorans]